MKKIIFILALIGLTQYTAHADAKKFCKCPCKTQKTAIHKAPAKHRTTGTATSGRSLMMANKGRYIPKTNYVVYNRVHMSNKIVCTAKKDYETDNLSSVMSPVVTTTTSTNCESKPYFTTRQIAVPASYKVKAEKAGYKVKTDDYKLKVKQ